MTDNEIIKALEICINCEYGSCPECSFDEICGCDNELKKAALDLIKRQQKRVEELTNAKVIFASVDYCLEDYQNSLEKIDKLKAEIESLESRIFALNDTNKILMETQEAYTNNKVKEFAERLKDKSMFLEDIERYVGNAVTTKDIDDLLKELAKTPQERLNDIAMRKGVMSKKINCGNCVYAKPVVAFGNSKCYVECTNKEHTEKYCKRKLSAIRQRTSAACKMFDEKEKGGE